MMIRHFLFTLFLSISFTLSAQEQSAPSTAELENGTIEDQFEYIKKVSTNYQEYKVIKLRSLEKLRTNILDSLNGYKSTIQELKATLQENKTQINDLNQKLSTTKADFDRAVEEKDSFSIFGMLLHKNFYNNLVWGIIILLILILVISYFRFKRSHQVTAETKQSLEDLREEFELHRRNTLERERKLNRQLVDALNKKDS
jgi:ABC-type transport system involved in multi-copper enzyme maturation permease subunit